MLSTNKGLVLSVSTTGFLSFSISGHNPNIRGRAKTRGKSHIDQNMTEYNGNISYIQFSNQVQTHTNLTDGGKRETKPV